MNLPIKILGFVNSFFWILLIGLVIFSAIPVADLGFMIFSPSQTFDVDYGLEISLPIRLDNVGSSEMLNVKVSSVLFDADEIELASDFSVVQVLEANDNESVILSLKFEPKDLFRRSEKYLFKNQNLSIFVSAGSLFKGILSAEISTNFSYPWGAPFENFNLLNPRIEVLNSSHSELLIEAKFDNLALFSLSGQFQINFFDNQTCFSSVGYSSIYVEENSSFSDELSFIVPSEYVSFLRDDFFEIEFCDSSYSYFVKEVSFD